MKIQQFKLILTVIAVMLAIPAHATGPCYDCWHTRRNDVIDGQGGNDKISGGSGADTIKGGSHVGYTPRTFWMLTVRAERTLLLPSMLPRLQGFKSVLVIVSTNLQ
jgi:RTX calcium-binding nonapeptide repeat (4 copies)